MSEPRDKLHNIHGRLFQAAMWRRYAMEWDKPFHGWVEHVLRVSRSECLRRARINLYLARRLNRKVTVSAESHRLFTVRALTRRVGPSVLLS